MSEICSFGVRKRHLLEVFLDKTPSDVDGFTENAKLYER